MHDRRFRFKLSTIIIFFVCLVVLLSLMITDLLISHTVSKKIINYQEEKALIVARTVAKSQIVIDELSNDHSTTAIQDYTKDIQTATNVMFIVVMDMNGIRKSHPNPANIGKHFVGGDEKAALKGKEYVSISHGTLGESVRAFTPLYNLRNKQIGVVAVGISLKSVESVLGKSHWDILIVTVLGLIIGVIGAILLARYIKRTLLGLEPFAIAKILEERSTMLQSVHEGIIAVDNQSTITLVNKSALQIFQKAGLSQKPVGMKIDEYMPSTRLDHVLETGKPELDDEQNINGVSILVNRVPLVVNGKVVGAISTFRDKTEVNQLAEQLTGVRTYAESLRAQSHEFMNRLHVILGMVQMKSYDELSGFIRTLVNYQNQEFGQITQHIKDPALAGFIMGKLSYAREENVEFSFECKNVIPEPKDPKFTQDLITILGNLIDNAIEALSDTEEKTLEVIFNYVDKFLTIEVLDSGPGMTEELHKKVFEKGFSTKGENRGYGLYLVANSIKKLSGELIIDSKLLLGTEFQIQIPYEEKRYGYD
ncbi:MULTISPECIES: DcuS/MalK family sensor histidine kinase [Bacillaceae]|uniref:DcuS/MalK family sensor histidine kinase n=1 Tax=Bacillaceae TaxID=186817 RepID=UPI000BEC4DB0|nr:MULTISPECIES: DcuS/MalK family sensor histidine kinase [unclassified Bacillus (in: firmicutes)]PEC51741.1 two-component system sensor histidine kinase DcuS [Bacillus sp. AFS096315]PET71412.1 two-component system sensor histidine kinase DcuS [Bacillus sp. AFS001701]PFM79858.1 two-component system sensor histidine kinase DcuS [Bacillus sp. AFS077874]